MHKISSQTAAFLTLVLAYIGAFAWYAADLAPARPARFFLGVDWSPVPVFLILFTVVLLPALFGPGLDLFSYMNDRVYFLFLILTFLCCVLKYYSGAASRAEMLLRVGLLLILYFFLRVTYRRAFQYGHINKYALRIFTYLLTGLAAPSLAAGFSGMSVWKILLTAALFAFLFVPFFLAGRPAQQESRPVLAVKRLCRALPGSLIPPAVFAFLPFLWWSL